MKEQLGYLLIEFCELHCNGCYGKQEDDGTVGCVYQEFLSFVNSRIEEV